MSVSLKRLRVGSCVFLTSRPQPPLLSPPPLTLFSRDQLLETENMSTAHTVTGKQWLVRQAGGSARWSINKYHQCQSLSRANGSQSCVHATYQQWEPVPNVTTSHPACVVNKDKTVTVSEIRAGMVSTVGTFLCAGLGRRPTLSQGTVSSVD